MLDTANYSRILALKQYELSNPLGNVLATVLDRRTMTSDKVLAYQTNFTGTTDGWTAGWSAAGTIYNATPPTTVVQNSNRLQCTATVSMGGIRKVIATTIGTAYTLTMDIDMGTAEGLYIMPRTTNGSNEFTGTNLAQVYLTSSGTYTVNFTATTSTTQLLVEKAGSVEKYFYVDNVKVEQSTPTLSSYPIADVVGAQYYYPYHSTMKSFTAGENLDYPFGGANGQEKDNEIFNGAYGALFWEYDSRLGGNGRWNVDPKPHPSISPYVTYVGNPIWVSDVLGDTTRIFDKRGRALGQINDSYSNEVHFMTEQAYNKIMKERKGLSDNLTADNIRAGSYAYYGQATEKAMKEQVERSKKMEREHVGVLAFIPGSRELEYLECTTCYGEATWSRTGPVLDEFKGRKLFATTHTHWQSWSTATLVSNFAKTPGYVDGDPRDHDEARDFRPVLNMGNSARLSGFWGGHPALIIHNKGVTLYPTFSYFGLKGKPQFSFDNKNIKSQTTIIPFSK